jgi:ABC transport system ATP-binding/permease protein
VTEKLGLGERRHTLVANLSGGQLKRVSLGVELIADPSLLFLDEVTSGLDAGTEAKMMTLFRQIADEGKTIVCITHNVENVNLCDLVAVLAKGRLVKHGVRSGPGSGGM